MTDEAGERFDMMVDNDVAEELDALREVGIGLRQYASLFGPGIHGLSLHDAQGNDLVMVRRNGKEDATEPVRQLILGYKTAVMQTAYVTGQTKH